METSFFSLPGQSRTDQRRRHKLKGDQTVSYLPAVEQCSRENFADHRFRIEQQPVPVGLQRTQLTLNTYIT